MRRALLFKHGPLATVEEIIPSFSLEFTLMLDDVVAYIVIMMLW